MSRAIVLTAVLIAANTLSACSSSDDAIEQIEQEVSSSSNEGPYGGHSIAWYKAHWKIETTEQRKWCRQQGEAAERMQSCTDAVIGWKQGWNDPKTNPPKTWDDGSR